MYWYSRLIKHKAGVVIFTTAAFLLSCQSDQQQSKETAENFIDIPTFFQKEIVRLSKSNPLVHKTVTKDTISETKELYIDNWETELSAFKTVDLNKPAYKGYLKKDSTESKIVFRSSDPKADLSFAEIQYGENGTPIAFLVKRMVKNSLYETEETLRYIKGESYSLEKKQSVLLLGDRYYHIQGSFRDQ